MMSLFVGPRRSEQIAGIVGYSGRLLAGDLLKKEIKTSPPVTLIHGAADEMVPAEALQHAVKGLEEVCLLYTSPSPRDLGKSRMPSSA